jgi:hypothetical protein
MSTSVSNAERDSTELECQRPRQDPVLNFVDSLCSQLAPSRFVSNTVFAILVGVVDESLLALGHPVTQRPRAAKRQLQPVRVRRNLQPHKRRFVIYSRNHSRKVVFGLHKSERVSSRHCRLGRKQFRVDRARHRQMQQRER